MPRSKQIIWLVWMLLAISALACYLIFPEWFDAARFLALLKDHRTAILLGYLLLSLVRGVFFIPSTPFIVAGALLFPESKMLVFLISMAGVVSGGTYVYFFTEFLEVEKVFKKHFAAKFEKVKTGMAKYGIWVVIFWAFFPAVPTDLISYTAGVTRMPYWKYCLGLFIGEVPLVAIYVFSGQALHAWLFA